MEQNITYHCPACNSIEQSVKLELKDYFLTQESFQILTCKSCGLGHTQPRPSIENIGSYYKSESYVSHSSSNKGLINTVYNLVRTRTIKKKLSLLSSLTQGNDLLDIGSGTGHFLKAAQNCGFVVIGLEPDVDARNFALSEHQLQLLDSSELYTLNKKFDVITMWHVLEHVYELNKDLEQISNLLNDNGVFVVAVPNHSSFDAAYYGNFWAAYDVPRHLYHFTPDTIIPLVEKFNLKFDSIYPMKFDSYYVSMLSEKLKQGSLFNALRIGWLSNFKAKKSTCSSQIYVFRKNS